MTFFIPKRQQDLTHLLDIDFSNPINDGLVSRYTFFGNKSTLIDLAGINNGTHVNSVDINYNRGGEALNFSNTNAYSKIPHNNSLNFGGLNKSFSIVCRYSTKETTGLALTSKFDETAASTTDKLPFLLDLNTITTGKLRAGWRDDDTVFRSLLLDNTSYNDGNIYTVIFVFDGNKNEVTFSTRLETKTTASNIDATMTNSAAIHIGALNNDGSLVFLAKNTNIYDVSFYNNALGSDLFQEIHHNDLFGLKQRSTQFYIAAAGGTAHSTSGTLATSGAVVTGTSAHIAVHATSGALANTGATVTGTATNFSIHSTNGALATTGAVVTGTATNFSIHATSGTLAPTGATIAGIATNYTVHATSGALANSGATVTGSASRSSATEHATSGALSNSGALITGTSAHIAIHGTSGALAPTGATITGSSLNFSIHATNGALVSGASVITGSALRATAIHETSGALASTGATITGTSARTREHATTAALVNSGAAVTGTASSFSIHATSGNLANSGAIITGSSLNFSIHATSGTLANSGALITGSAAINQTANDGTGALIAAGAVIAGTATRGNAADMYPLAGLTQTYPLTGKI